MTLLRADSSLAAETNKPLHWKKLPSLPDREGFAGPFAGSHNGALIVAGGANFPDKRPWEGGTKIWYDSVFVLEKPDGEWKTGFKLPRPLGYGVSLQHKNGILCLGGSDAQSHRAEAFSLSWDNEKIRTTPLPNLPHPCANMCGALLDNIVYIAGGLENPTATNTLKTFWALDLTKPEAGWKTLEPWPGPGRMLAVAGVQNGAFYLFGGAALHAGPDNKPVRDWLQDAYCFTPGHGWKRIADLPHASVAAPSPAPEAGHSQLLLIGGDDGKQVSTPPLEHHGFPREVLAYNTTTDTWTKHSEVPFSLVTTASVHWKQCIVIPGGEARPGIRSTEVWAGSFADSH